MSFGSLSQSKNETKKTKVEELKEEEKERARRKERKMASTIILYKEKREMMDIPLLVVKVLAVSAMD